MALALLAMDSRCGKRNPKIVNKFIEDLHMYSNVIKTIFVLLALLGLVLGVSAKEGEEEEPKEKVFFRYRGNQQHPNCPHRQRPVRWRGIGVSGRGISLQHRWPWCRGYRVHQIECDRCSFITWKISRSFSGTYVQVRAGATLGKGSGVLQLGNKWGVEMHLKASQKGVALTLGADGMSVKLIEKKE